MELQFILGSQINEPWPDLAKITPSLGEAQVTSTKFFFIKPETLFTFLAFPAADWAE
jgi:hypothetical protein